MRPLFALGASLLAAATLAPAPALADRASAPDAPARAAAHDDGTRMPWLGLRLGGIEAVGSAGGGAPGGGGGGAYALFDARDFLADVAADVYVGERARFFALGLGAYYPYGAGNVAPYAGGGLKVGWTRFGGDGAFGMLPFVAAGVVVGREGYVQLSPFLVLANAVLGESERFPVELRFRVARPQLGGASAAPPRPPTAAVEEGET